MLLSLRVSFSGLPLGFLGAYGNPCLSNPAGNTAGQVAEARVGTQEVLNDYRINITKAMPFPVFSRRHPLARGDDFWLGVSWVPDLSER